MLAYRRFRRAARRLSGRQAAALAAVALAVLATASYRVYAQLRSAVPANPNQAIQAAASASAAMTSARATFTTQVSGLTTLYGTVRERRSPHLLATFEMTAVNGAERLAVSEVVTGSDVYLAMPSLAAAVGRPWLAVPIYELAADPAMAELFQGGVFPSAEAGLLGYVSGARRAGGGFVGGVRTTRYVGTVDPATALAELSPALRRLLGPELTATAGQIQVTVWVDGQQYIRKVVSTSIVSGLRTVTTVVFTAANPVLNIRVPAAGQVTAIGRGVLPAS